MVDTGPQTPSSPTSWQSPRTPWGPPDPQPAHLPSLCGGSQAIARNPDVPAPQPHCLQPFSSFPLLPTPSRCGLPSDLQWDSQNMCVCLCVCVCVCVCVFVCVCTRHSGDAQRSQPHSDGVDRDPRASQGLSFPGGTPWGVEAGLGLETSPAPWTLHTSHGLAQSLPLLPSVSPLSRGSDGEVHQHAPAPGKLW